MSLHEQIMNIKPFHEFHELPSYYRDGFEEAQEEAAELALKADAEIERLNTLIENLLGEKYKNEKT